MDLINYYITGSKIIELPWGDTTDNNEEFAKWKKDVYISETPWSKLGNTALSLAKQILKMDPNKRLTLEQIEKHPWMKFNFDCGEFPLVCIYLKIHSFCWHFGYTEASKLV